MTFNPGRLKERVEVRRLSESRISGEIVHNWSNLTTVWAEVLPRGSREAWRQLQVVEEVEYLVRIRRYNGLTTKDRLKWNSLTLEIVGAIEADVDGAMVTELYCTRMESA